MKSSMRHLVAVAILAVGGANGIAQAQPYVIPMAATAGTPVGAVGQQEMDAILAPIALYPDTLLAHILMAATYPSDVADAARWSRSIPGVPAEEAVRSVGNRGWDYSVQTLMAFPQILDMMDRAPDWTRRLGDAFLGQQAQVWATVQSLRQRAYTMGQLRSSDQLRVLFNGSLIVLEPAQPEVVYVPYYDPLRVYGNWWWPGYAPMRWEPWPGYVVRPGRGVHYYTGPSIRIGLNFFFGNVDWHSQRVIVAPTPRWVDRSRNEHRENPGRAWQHDDNRRGNDDHRRDTPPKRFVAPAAPIAPVAPAAPRVQAPPPRHDNEPSRMIHQAPHVQNAPAAAKPEHPPAPHKSEPAAQQPQPDHLGTKPINAQEQEKRFNPKENGARTY